VHSLPQCLALLVLVLVALDPVALLVGRPLMAQALGLLAAHRLQIQPQNRSSTGQHK
jgi:hypothetical protein